MNKSRFLTIYLCLTVLFTLVLSFSCVKVAPKSIAPTVSITSPNGDEKWDTGSNQIITYTMTGTGISKVKIEYSMDGGSRWFIISFTAGTGSCSWKIPDIPTVNCLVRITLLDAGDTILAQDTSNRPFSIVKPGVALQPPAAATIFPRIVTPAPGQMSASDKQAAISSATTQINRVIAYSLSCAKESLPKNPHLQSEYKTQIAILQDPDLYNKIVKGNFFVVDSYSSSNGAKILIVATYTAESMRDEANYALQIVKMSMPVLEAFMSVPYPSSNYYIWYGFDLGNSGGTGLMYMEDQKVYESRWKPPMVPYVPIICHELSHTYIGHEGLNQFLEIYTSNLIAGHTASFSDWIYLRDYKTWQGTKTGYAAVLDIYQLIGLDTIQKAYREIYKIKPPYGQNLSAQCKQVFIDQSPSNLKSQVSAIVANITY